MPKDHDDIDPQPHPPEVTPKTGDPYDGIDALTGVPPVPGVGDDTDDE